MLSVLAVILCGCDEQNDNPATGEEATVVSSQTAANESTVNNNNNIADVPATEQEHVSQSSAVEAPTSPAAKKTYGKVTGIEAISQYPELPTGCEVTSLATVLNFYGVNIDKCDIADNYLNKGDVGTVDFHVAFEGDPRDAASFGCYSGVIVDAANRIISEKGAALTVTDYTGTELEDLFGFISDNTPVIVWGTQDCQEGHYSVTWNVDGQELTWFSPEHCMVLVGYDDINVLVCDPIYGDIRKYDKTVFKNCYDSLFKQAVVIAP